MNVEKNKKNIKLFWKKTETIRTRSLIVICALFLLVFLCFSFISESMMRVNDFAHSKLRYNLLADAVLPTILGMVGFGIFLFTKNSLVTCFFWGLVFFHWTCLGSLNLGDEFEEESIIFGLIVTVIGILIIFFTKNIPSGLIIYGSVLSLWSLSKVGEKN